VDSAAWLVAIYIACGWRLDTWQGEFGHYAPAVGSPIPLVGALAVAAVTTAVTAICGLKFMLHRGRAAIGSFEELRVLAEVVVIAGVAAFLVNLVMPTLWVPRTVPLIAACLALVLAAAPRGIYRAIREHLDAHSQGDRAVTKPVVIVGAGNAGMKLVDSMVADPDGRWRPVAFVDDDLTKRFRRHRGVRVLGRLDDLVQVASRTGAECAVIAIPSGGPNVLNRVREIAGDTIDVKVLPGLADLMAAGVSHTTVRDVKPTDLLSRPQIDIDVVSIAGYLTGRRVLVVGAGGSIGSELSRRVAKFGPAELLLLDRDESALHALMLSLEGRADLESGNAILADIRDAKRIRQVMETYRPDVVFHAAALKHVNMLEHHAVEAVKSNVLGTMNVLEAAEAAGVKRVVNISTDKAADPICVLGYTKRIAEGITADYAARTGLKCLSVRFGNVLGTRGSVLKTFEAQVARGGPITVTHPEVTRFFMTVSEAVQLVIQAAAVGGPGEVLVLDMGDPVRINDIAEQMSRCRGRPDIEITYTGLKPGEKLHENLFGAGEVDLRPFHPLVSHIPVPMVSRDDVESLIANSEEATIKALRDLVNAMALRQQSCELLT
jgi:FlaA1/EpsC-like NDP-sugar epimerase